MKRLYKLIPLLSLAIVTPTVFLLSSCSITGAATYEITKQALENKTSVKKLKHGPGLKSLLYGNKNFHKGNYVLFLNTLASPAINRVLFGNENNIFTQNSTLNAFGATLNLETFNKIQDNIQDIANSSTYKGKDTGFVWLNVNDVFWDNKTLSIYSPYMNSTRDDATGVKGIGGSSDGSYISAFEKWTKADEQRYQNDKKKYKKCKADKFIRQDKNAKDWRWLTQTYLDKLIGITGDNSFVMAQWVNGKLVGNLPIVDYDPSLGNNSTLLDQSVFSSWICDNFKNNWNKK